MLDRVSDPIREKSSVVDVMVINDLTVNEHGNEIPKSPTNPADVSTGSPSCAESEEERG